MTTPAPPLAADREKIAQTLALLFEPGDVYEIRALGCSYTGFKRPHAEYGYFDNPELAVEAAVKLSGERDAKGVYVTVNRLDPALLARCSNRLEIAGKGSSTSDKDVTQRRWLLVDLDPVRPSGISSTETGLSAARKLAGEIRRWLSAQGLKDPITCASGNGAHLLYRIDLPGNDDGLCESILKVLDARFSNDDVVKVDPSTHHAAQLGKLFGTPVRKGEDVPDRPHRLSAIKRVPEWAKNGDTAAGVTPIQVLQTLVAGNSLAQPDRGGLKSAGAQSFDVHQFLTLAGVEFKEQQAPDKTIYSLTECPFCQQSNGNPAVLQMADGVLNYRCFKDQCDGKKWADFRALYDTKWTDSRPRQQRTGRTGRDYVNPDWPSSGEEPLFRELKTIRASDVVVKPVRFLVPDRIVEGKLTLLMGMPGDGKSTIALDIAAAMSKGGILPDGSMAPRGATLYISAEDSAADTLKPRLIRQGADCDKVIFVDLPAMAAEGWYLSLDDLPLIEQKAVEYQVKLIVIDPVFAFMGDTDIIKTVKVRKILTAISLMADRTGISVLGISHPNKAQGGHILDRVSGVRDFAAAARSILIAGRDLNDPKKRYLGSIKNSVGPEPPMLAYHFEDDGTLVWDGVADEINVDDLLRSASAEQVEQRAEATEAIADLLSDGPKPAAEVLSTVTRETGCGKNTVRRAQKNMGITRETGHVYRETTEAGKAVWMWRLPTPEIQDTQGVGKQGGYLDVGHLESRSTTPTEQGTLETVKMPSNRSVGILSKNRPNPGAGETAPDDSESTAGHPVINPAETTPARNWWDD